MRSTKDQDDSSYEKSRLEELKISFKIFSEKDESEIEFTIEKKILNSETLWTNQNFSKLVEEREEYILNHASELTELSIQKLRDDITLVKQDSKIFDDLRRFSFKLNPNNTTI